MPHIIVEYSDNLTASIVMPLLLEKLAKKAVETGAFPLGGVRVRAHRCEDYVVADNLPENAFVHVWVRIGTGRDLATRKQAGQALFDVLSDHLKPIFAERPLTIGLEMQELHPDLNFRKNNIHARLGTMATAGG
jgi:5-carboxymethyl-2-hydroxymuconate isomerase